jgi:hypothetical protein
MTDSHIVLSSGVNDVSKDLLWFTLMTEDEVETDVVNIHPADLIEFVQNAALTYCTKN